jgi:hypothetical protein
LFVE